MTGILTIDGKSSIQVLNRRALFVAISFCLLTPNYLVSQNTGTATIEGTVIDATSGNSLSGVRMQITPSSRSVLTDAEGKFVLAGVAPGAYMLSGQKPGYMNLRREGRRTPGNSGIPMALKAGDRSQWNFRMFLAPILSGRIMDERGRPVQGIRVLPYRLVYDENGKVIQRFFPAIVSNDLGEYRFNNLDPGEYRLEIEPPSSLGNQPNGSLYYPVHYPGVSDVRAASPITLKSAEETRLLDIVLPAARGATFHLEILAEPGSTFTKDFTVSAKRRESTSSLDRISASFKTANGDIGPLAPGLYDIQVEGVAASERMTGIGSIEIDQKDASFPVRLQRSATVQGRVIFNSSSDTSRSIPSMELRLADVNAPLPIAMRFVSGADGTLRATLPLGVSPGTYSVQVTNTPPELYISSIRERQQDILKTGLTIRGDEMLNIEVVVGAAGFIQGTVQTSNGSPAIDSVVVLVPDRRDDSHLYRVVRTNEGGAFDISGAPGVYKVFAWSELEGAAYRDPEFINKFEAQGRTATIESGGHLTMNLNVLD
jgi:hypothetical protein